MELTEFRNLLDQVLAKDYDAIWQLLVCHTKGTLGLPPLAPVITEYIKTNFHITEEDPSKGEWINVDDDSMLAFDGTVNKNNHLFDGKVFIVECDYTNDIGKYNEHPLSVVPYYRLKEAVDQDWTTAQGYAERRAKKEAERIAKEETERKAREEAERIAKEEAERKAKEEAERIAKEEAERKAREEAERIAKEEAERKAKEIAKRIAQSVAEQKAKEKAERKAKEEKLVEQTSLIAADDIQKLKASFALVKGGTFLSRFSEEGQHIEEIGDFYISEVKVSKLLGDSLLSDGTDRATADGQQTLTRRLSMLLGFEVSVTSISQLEYVLRGGDQLNQSQIERSKRYLASSNLTIYNYGIDTFAKNYWIKKVDDLFEFYCIHLVCPPETFAIEIERKAKEEAERKAKEEAERKAKEEAERKAKEEAERKAKEEAERKAKEEAERKAKEEAERKAKEEAERKAKEEAERIAKEEAERKAKEETERIAKEEAERKAKEETERKAKEEAERKAKEEAERMAKEEVERKAKEEIKEGAERNSYKSLIEDFVSDIKECEYKDGIIFGKKKKIHYVANPITKRIWNAVVNKSSEADFDDNEFVPQKELGTFLENLNSYYSGKIVFEYLHKNIHALVHLQVYEKQDKNACFVYIKEEN